jgi:hypothetical protein
MGHRFLSGSPAQLSDQKLVASPFPMATSVIEANKAWSEGEGGSNNPFHGLFAPVFACQIHLMRRSLLK